MVNIPIWEQCKTEFLLKCKQHFERISEHSKEVQEQLSQIDSELDLRKSKMGYEHKVTCNS
jgi:hypothetical protein